MMRPYTIHRHVDSPRHGTEHAASEQEDRDAANTSETARIDVRRVEKPEDSRRHLREFMLQAHGAYLWERLDMPIRRIDRESTETVGVEME